MLELQKLCLTNIHYYKQAEVQLDQNSVVFIRGMNYDASPHAGKHEEKTGNGAGKSLLFSTIPNMFLSAPPLAEKKKSTKDIIGKGSKVELHFRANNTDYHITQSSSGCVIRENGEDLQVRTKPLQEKFIRELFPLRDIEYYTYGYLASQRPFLMQTDTDSNRLEHFTSMFRLDNYAEMRKHFATKLSEVKGNEAKLAVLEQSALTLRKKLRKSNASFDRKMLERTRAEYETLDRSIQKLSEKQFAQSNLSRTLNALMDTESELDALRKRYTDRRPPKEYMAYAKYQRGLVKSWDEYASVKASYEKTVSGLHKQLDDIKLPKRSLEKLKSDKSTLESSCEALENEISDLEKTEEKFEEYSSRGKKLMARFTELGYDYRKYVAEDKDYDEEIAQCRTSLKLEALLHEHEGDTCPTCLSVVDRDNIDSVVKRAKKQLPKLKAAKEARSLYTDIKELSGKLKALNYEPTRLAELRDEHKASESKLQSLTSDIEIHRKHARIKATLDSVEKPKSPKEKPDTELTYEQLGKQIDLCADILRHLSGKAKLIENHPEIAQCRTVQSVKDELKKCNARLADLDAEVLQKKQELSKLAIAIEQQAVAQSEVNLYQSELSEAHKKIAELKPALEDKDILEVLVKAYGTKGLKTVVANDICGLLETNLNSYRDLIFMEPFTFSVSASDTGLSILVDRGRGHVSDVRLLSGAESNCFRLLFVLSILPLVPDSRRLNMIVLDEPTALMHPVTRRFFVERYLPALMEIIPHIYIITPNNEYIEGSAEWIVQKKDGVSTVLTDPIKNLLEIADNCKRVKRGKR